MLASQMGPPVRDFVGSYDWKPAAPCCMFGGGGKLVAIDRDMFEWKDTKGCPCGPLHPVHARSTEHPDMFIGLGDTTTCYPMCASCGTNVNNVWVLSHPTKPIKLYSSLEEAIKGQAPGIVAMRRDEDESAEIFQPTTADSTGRRVAGDARPERKGKPLTQAQQDRAYIDQQRAENKLAEQLAVKESITNDQRKQQKKQAKGSRSRSEEVSQLTQAQKDEAEKKAVAKAIASDKLRRENKAKLAQAEMEA